MDRRHALKKHRAPYSIVSAPDLPHAPTTINNRARKFIKNRAPAQH
jgi:hypothetical protein